MKAKASPDTTRLSREASSPISFTISSASESSPGSSDDGGRTRNKDVSDESEDQDARQSTGSPMSPRVQQQCDDFIKSSAKAKTGIQSSMRKGDTATDDRGVLNAEDLPFDPYFNPHGVKTNADTNPPIRRTYTPVSPIIAPASAYSPAITLPHRTLLHSEGERDDNGLTSLDLGVLGDELSEIALSGGLSGATYNQPGRGIGASGHGRSKSATWKEQGPRNVLIRNIGTTQPNTDASTHSALMSSLASDKTDTAQPASYAAIAASQNNSASAALRDGERSKYQQKVLASPGALNRSNRTSDANVGTSVNASNIPAARASAGDNTADNGGYRLFYEMVSPLYQQHMWPSFSYTLRDHTAATNEQSADAHRRTDENTPRHTTDTTHSDKSNRPAESEPTRESQGKRKDKKTATSISRSTSGGNESSNTGSTDAEGEWHQVGTASSDMGSSSTDTASSTVSATAGGKKQQRNAKRARDREQERSRQSSFSDNSFVLLADLDNESSSDVSSSDNDNNTNGNKTVTGSKSSETDTVPKAANDNNNAGSNNKSITRKVGDAEGKHDAAASAVVEDAEEESESEKQQKGRGGSRRMSR